MKMKCKQQFFMDYWGGGGVGGWGGGVGVGGGGGGVVQYRTIFWPPGRVGIAFDSVTTKAL